MKKDLYNSTDEEFKHVIKLLKDLPKVNAPDNFQYNLNIKIENRHFELNTKEYNPFLPWKIVLPVSSAVVITILFFAFFIESDNLENPFQIQPKLRTEISSSVLNADKSTEIVENNMISENDVILKEEKTDFELNSIPENQNKEKQLIAEFPFDPSKSTNLDEVITDETGKTSISRRANLVGRSNSNSNFSGFFIREEINKEEFEALKARNDSLIKAFRDRKLNRGF